MGTRKRERAEKKEEKEKTFLLTEEDERITIHSIILRRCLKIEKLGQMSEEYVDN